MSIIFTLSSGQEGSEVTGIGFEESFAMNTSVNGFAASTIGFALIVPTIKAPTIAMIT